VLAYRRARAGDFPVRHADEEVRQAEQDGGSADRQQPHRDEHRVPGGQSRASLLQLRLQKLF